MKNGPLVGFVGVLAGLAVFFVLFQMWHQSSGGHENKPVSLLQPLDEIKSAVELLHGKFDAEVARARANVENGGDHQEAAASHSASLELAQQEVAAARARADACERRIADLESVSSPPAVADADRLAQLTAVELAHRKILLFITSYDRGAFARGYDGDKLELIKRIVSNARVMCEAGHSVSIALIAAWKISEQLHEFSKVGFCSRINQQVPIVTVVDHFDGSIQGNLSFQHRILIEKHINDYDFFIQTEDDMLVTLSHVTGHLRHTEKLRLAGFPEHSHLYPGFLRYEEDEHGLRHLFEANLDMVANHLVQVEGAGLYMLQAGGNVHQGFWMGTRAQVVELNRSCNQPFLGEPYGPWVEFWSGGLQIFFFCERWKAVPVADFDLHLIHHAANSKLKLDVTELMELNEFKSQIFSKTVEDPNLFVNNIRPEGKPSKRVR